MLFNQRPHYPPVNPSMTLKTRMAITFQPCQLLQLLALQRIQAHGTPETQALQQFQPFSYLYHVNVQLLTHAHVQHGTPETVNNTCNMSRPCNILMQALTRQQTPCNASSVHACMHMYMWTCPRHACSSSMWRRKAETHAKCCEIVTQFEKIFSSYNWISGTNCKVL